MPALSLLVAHNLNTFRGQDTDPSGTSLSGAVVRLTPQGGREQRKNSDFCGYLGSPFGLSTSTASCGGSSANRRIVPELIRIRGKRTGPLFVQPPSEESLTNSVPPYAVF